MRQAGNLTSQLTAGDPGAGDPAGTTTWGYDALGRQISETDPLGNLEGASQEAHTTHFTYDLAGNKAGQIDPDDAVTLFFYDAAGRMCRRVAVASGQTADLPEEPCSETSPTDGAAVDTLYEHDAAGNQTAISLREV